MNDESFITVAEFWQRIQAEQARAFLEQNGIPAVIWTDDAGGLGPSMGFVNGYQVKVNGENASVAEEILSDFGLDQRGV